MSQNINLFNAAFRKKRRVLTLMTVVQCVGITLAALAGYQYYLHRQVNSLTVELQTTDSQLRAQRDFLEKARAKAAAPQADTQLDADIARFEAELKHAREAMVTLKGGAFGNQQGFAEYLRAFSRQSLQGLWLTGFTIAGSGELEIRGRVLSPDLVPSYIQRLNREQVLAGRSFARLEMSRPKAAPAPDKDAKKAAPRVPRYLEFSLATTDAARTEKTP